MRTLCVYLLICLASVPAWAQRKSAAPDASPSIRVSTAVEAPQSNIDLLKQSLQTSSAVAGPADAAALPAVPAPAPSAVQPAAQAASSATTLDMPLDMGGTVQSVQTSVAPVKKTLSPSVAARVQQANQKRAQAAKKTSKPTALEKDIEKSNALLPASEQAAQESEGEFSEEEAAADAELEYAVKMLEKSKEAV